MWLTLAILSATLCGFYDAAKKQAVKSNGVIQILFWATFISALFFLPLIISAQFDLPLAKGTRFELTKAPLEHHLLLLGKAVVVSISWIAGCYGIKNLPMTISGTIKATRPVFVIVLSMILFNERLNVMQWAGVAVSMFAFYLLSVSSKSEGIVFRNNKWFWCMIVSVLAGVASSVYDKFLMQRLSPVFVQSWCNFYIASIMALVLLVCRLRDKDYVKFKWDWMIMVIAVFVTVSDFAYFLSLSMEDAMLSVVAMIRRSSVIVTFLCGVVFFKEKNIKSKAIALAVLLLGMALLVFGSK